MNFTIRKAKELDAEAIAQILRELGLKTLPILSIRLMSDRHNDGT